jgi:hypothetical protein
MTKWVIAYLIVIAILSVGAALQEWLSGRRK